jgi:hypothetical protein
VLTKSVGDEEEEWIVEEVVDVEENVLVLAK